MNRAKLLVSVGALVAATLPSACARRHRDEGNAPAPLQPVARPAATPAAPAAAPPAAPPAPDAAPPVAAPPTEATNQAPTPITLQRTIVLGRWPEGLSARGNEAWVAESGDRSIAHVDLSTGAVLDRTPSGRLPIRVQAVADGSVQVVSATDKTVWTQTPGARRARRLARLPDDPQDVVWTTDGALWALLWRRGSSASGSVVRLAAGERDVTPLAPVGANAMALAVGHDRVWIAQTDTVAVIDGATGQARPPVAVPGYHTRVAACARGVYVNDREAVVRIDPATSTVSGRLAMADGARALACGPDGSLWVVGAHGRVSRHDPVSLTVTGAASPSTPFEPVAAWVSGGRLLVTTHALGGSDASGALLVFNAP